MYERSYRLDFFCLIFSSTKVDFYCVYKNDHHYWSWIQFLFVCHAHMSELFLAQQTLTFATPLYNKYLIKKTADSIGLGCKYIHTVTAVRWMDTSADVLACVFIRVSVPSCVEYNPNFIQTQFRKKWRFNSNLLCQERKKIDESYEKISDSTSAGFQDATLLRR